MAHEVVPDPSLSGIVHVGLHIVLLLHRTLLRHLYIHSDVHWVYVYILYDFFYDMWICRLFGLKLVCEENLLRD